MTRTALLQTEIALVWAGQTQRPDRVGSLLMEPDVAKSFDAKAMARARAEVGRAALDDLLCQQLETARTTYHTRKEEFLAGTGMQDTLLEWSRRLLESELALADGPAGHEAALARHWMRAWQSEAVTRDLSERGRKATAEVMAARYVRLDAELLWAQARQARK